MGRDFHPTGSWRSHRSQGSVLTPFRALDRSLKATTPVKLQGKTSEFQKEETHYHQRISLQYFHYTRDITPKRVTSGGIHLRGLAPGQHSSEETSQRCRHSIRFDQRANRTPDLSRCIQPLRQPSSSINNFKTETNDRTDHEAGPCTHIRIVSNNRYRPTGTRPRPRAGHSPQFPRCCLALLRPSW